MITTNSLNYKESKRNKEYSLHFTVNELFYSDIPLLELSKICKIGERYSIITRVLHTDSSNIYNNDVTDWKTLGEQIYLEKIDNVEFSIIYNRYINNINNRLEECIQRYDFVDQNILAFQLLLYRIHYTENVVPKNVGLSTFGNNKDLINSSKIKLGFGLLPLTSGNDKFGTLLQKNVDNNELKSISVNDYSYVVGKINENLFNKDHKFFINNETDIYKNNDGNIITVNSVDSTSNISIYDENGIIIQNVVEKPIDNNNFYRQVGNVKAYINNKVGVYKKTIDYTFHPVYPKKNSGHYKRLLFSDDRIGTLDLETYVDNYGISKTYAIGFCVKYDKTTTFYLEKDLNSDSLIIKCLDAMLVERHNGFTFYVHNLGRFDIYFLLKVIVTTCDKLPDIYNYDIIVKDGTIISLSLVKKIGKKSYKIKIVDSYNLLDRKLSDLCEAYDCKTRKGNFPYKFVKNDTLYYEGKKPDFSYYQEIDRLTYDLIPNDKWSTQNETIDYLKDDLISLYEIIYKFKMNIFTKYNSHITRSLTISGVAMNIFLNKYYDNNIPLINKRSVYNDIKMSYFGGITEVYKPYGKNLYYYDVNSLYPFAALNTMPGLNCTYVDNINMDIGDYIHDMFGFYYCKIEARDGYLGLLPYHSKDLVLMPNGSFEGWYFSEELKFAYMNNYKIQIIKGYNFSKSYNVFDKYIKEVYKIKSTTKDSVEKSVAKSLLNNLLGRFGMKLDKSITELVVKEDYNILLQTKKINNVVHIGDDNKLVTYETKVSKKICDTHNVDHPKAVNSDIKYSKKTGFTRERLHDVSIAVASAVTSYARIHMNKIKLEILNANGSIYYTDTDSIATDVELDESYIGNEIGKLKLEHRIKEGYFLNNKSYCITNTKNEIKIKRSGLDKNLLTIDDFKKLYNGESVTLYRKVADKSLSEGYVNIDNTKKFVLSPDSYNKRLKVYEDNLWVDTKPIILPC